MVYAQPNSWQCGPFALKHALLVYGRVTHEDDLARLAGSTESVGTDERGLARALEAHGGTLKIIRRRTRLGARRELTSWLRRGVPVLLCVDQWDHWITAVADLGPRVALFDSHFDNAVFRTEPWHRLLERLVFRRRRLRLWVPGWWDLHPVLLSQRMAARLERERLDAPLADCNADLAVVDELLGRSTFAGAERRGRPVDEGAASPALPAGAHEVSAAVSF